VVEVLVAGAGPAGAAAAIVLARAGMRVLLVDRARFPRPKLCGDTLNPGALAIASSLGVGSALDAHGLPLEGMKVIGASGLTVSATYDGVRALASTRERLDVGLVEAAARAGAQVEEDVRVIGPLLDEATGQVVVRGAVLERRSGPLRVPAAWTVGADGRRSALAIALGLSRHPAAPRRWAVGAYYTDVEGLSAFGEMHIRRGYYVGVAPVIGGLANACVVTADRGRLAQPQQALARTLAEDPVLRDRFAGARRVSAVSCVGPLAVDCQRPGHAGLLLAGDAAGFIDPMTGDGLRFALQGGVLAAEAILAAFDRPALSAVDALRSARRRAFSRKQHMNRALRRLVGHDVGVRVSEIGAACIPGAIARIIRAAGDLHALAPRPV
jgi:flavin-dependent dehydrogenase